jgi:hypothetical protein
MAKQFKPKKIELIYAENFSMVFDASGVEIKRECGTKPEADGQVRVIFKNCWTLGKYTYFGDDKFIVTAPEVNAEIIAAAILGRAPLLAAIKRNYDLDFINDDDNNNSLLSLAARKGEVEKCLDLIDCGADIESKNNIWKRTPLMLAAAWGQTKTCIALLERGADSECKNDDGLTPAQLAENTGKDETASAIRSWITRRTANRLLDEIEDGGAE